MSGNLGTSNAKTPAVSTASAFGQNNATFAASTSNASTVSFASAKPATGSSPFGGGTSAFGGSGSASGVVPAGGTSGTDVSAGRAASNVGSAFGASGGSSPFGQPGPATTLGITPANANPPPVRAGTSMPAYSATWAKEVPYSNFDSLFSTITAMPAYQGTSLEELRTQDYQQNRKTSDASGKTLSGAFAMPTSRPATSTTTGPIFGSSTTSAFGTTTSQPTTGPFGAFGQQQSTPAPSSFLEALRSGILNSNNSGTSIFGSKPAFGQQKPASGSRSIFGQLADPMLDPSKRERIEELLRKSLLGEELVNTQFHLFSARSLSSGRVTKPRVLCANNALLAKSSKYFLDLLSLDIDPSDSSLVDLTGDNDVPSDARIDDYGYDSDSDLDDCDDPGPVAKSEAAKDQSSSLTSPSEGSGEAQAKDDDESSKASSDTLVMTSEQRRAEVSIYENKDGAGSLVNSKSTIQMIGNEMRLRSLGSRHVLVKDTAFQTWYTLLNYLYTGKFSFLPLSSTTPGGKRGSSTSPLDVPGCSAKSMYHLTFKVGLDRLRDEAFSYIRSNLTEHNILKELSCSLLSKHPQLLEMELDMLYSHIESPPVTANFAALAQRIAHGELPHGADIMVGIYTRLLKERHPFSLKPYAPTLPPSLWGSPGSVKPDANTNDVREAEATDKTGPSHADKRDTPSGSLPSGSGVSESTANVPPRASTSVAIPTATGVTK